VVKNGGKVLGRVRHPFPATDFSSFLLQAQASKAKIIGLANDRRRHRQLNPSEFGLVRDGQKLAALLVFITDVHALGLQASQGLIMTEALYRDLDDANREFAKKFAPYPTMVHAGVYSAVTHYLKAVEALKSDAGREG
jgi:branched-chain amino acid transport system substrate-binding protein